VSTSPRGGEDSALQPLLAAPAPLTHAQVAVVRTDLTASLVDGGEDGDGFGVGLQR
jgi:hypothetical protein